ncbi:hypothetical protein BDM02DRAFT_3182457 [Thelephora ganbajun]|uniref:Uncharacterized protein n=1 Tax=Thelephora ganbajun TaxID=370292 RepID=A0ACB6ZWK1_THEGA|nr:hypothetical protein BDM02DRAFT_3182457 [Thelephora ganbajun]
MVAESADQLLPPPTPMQPLPLLDFPIDVLFLILYELSVDDLLSLASTCKTLYTISNDRCVWLEQLECIRTRMPFLHKDRPNLLHASTDALRRESILQTRLDRLWCRHDSPPGQIIEVIVEEAVNFFTVFPGGQWLVIILEDGRLCLRELCEPDQVPKSITVKLGASVREVMHNFWASRAVDGSAILALSQYATSHSVMHFYRISPAEMSISYLGNKHLPKCRWASPIRNYPTSENLLACLHLGSEPGAMALTLLVIPDPLNSPEGFRCEEVATIGLGKFENHTPFGVEDELFSICVPYTHILVVTHGSTSIKIFNIPPLETLPTSQAKKLNVASAPVIWEWHTPYIFSRNFEPTILMPHTPCQLVLPGEKSARNFHLVAEDTLTLHLIEFAVSRSTKPGTKVETVIHHRMHTTERDVVEGNTYLALRSHRGAWLTKGNHDLTFSTLTFQDYSKDYLAGKNRDYPLPLGSFGINYDMFEPHLVDWDYDEVSGRFCLLVQGDDGDWAVLLVDRLGA